MNNVRICPIHPKTGKWVFLKIQKIWKLKCKKCYSLTIPTEKSN